MAVHRWRTARAASTSSGSVAATSTASCNATAAGSIADRKLTWDWDAREPVQRAFAPGRFTPSPRT